MDLAVNMPAAASAQRTASKRSRRRPMPMVMKLAYRNLFHDRMSFFVTIIGITVYGEHLALPVAIGTGIVVAAGLYALSLERKRA